MHTLSSLHAVVTTRRQLPLSLSLSHALYNYSLQNINNNKNVCPKSYLYIYDFRVIYINVHSNRSDRSEPVLVSAGSLYLPSGGTCFPTNSPFTPAWDVAPIRSASDTLPACRVSKPWSACLTRSRSCGSSSARTLVPLLAPGSNDTSTRSRIYKHARRQ